MEKVSKSPFWIGLLSGLYPLLFIYSYNFAFLYNAKQFLFYVGVYLVVPMVICFIAWLFIKWKVFGRLGVYLLPFINVFGFLFLMKMNVYGNLSYKITLLLMLISLLTALMLYKHFVKLITFQILLSIIGFFTLTNTIITATSHTKDWLKKEDVIQNAVFQKKPNIYFIQPDGYTNFSEMDKGHYKIAIPALKDSLTQWGFTHYPSFRTNYASTVYSNSSLFMMRHHYYHGGKVFNEALEARDIIISDNTVLKILKQNGYSTHYIAQSPYLLLNRPELGFTTSNFTYAPVGFINMGFKGEKEVTLALAEHLEQKYSTPQFYFIEFFYPGHINGKKSESLGAEKEKENWLQLLEKGNETISQLTTQILAKDPEALIIIAADHGGFVGMDYTQQIYQKTQNEATITSMFSSQLSIHWPQNNIPQEDQYLTSSVNLFRIIFSYLSNSTSYLNTLEPDESYVILKEGAPPGVYKYINHEGNIVCEKIL